MSSVADPILILRSPEPIRFMTSAIAAFWVCAGVAGEVAFEDCSVAAAAGWSFSAFFLALHSDSSCWTLSGSTPRSMQKGHFVLPGARPFFCFLVGQFADL